jgi:hypothetical protein
MQSQEQIIQISQEWQLSDAPDDLILRGDKGEFNGKILAQCIADRFNGVYSRENLTKAYELRKADLILRGDKVVTQSPQEAASVRTEWWAKFAPKDLPFTDSNDMALAAYVQKYFGLTSITALNEAAIHAPSLQREDIHAAAAKKAEERRLRDIRQSKQTHSSQPSIEDLQKTSAAEKAAREEALRQQGAQREIDRLISEYSVAARFAGRIDHAKSEHGRSLLRGKKAYKNGKYDAAATLKLVQAALTELP